MHQCTFKGRKGNVLHMQSRIYSFRSFFPENSSFVFGHHYLLQTKSDFSILKRNLDHKL